MGSIHFECVHIAPLERRNIFGLLVLNVLEINSSFSALRVCWTSLPPSFAEARWRWRCSSLRREVRAGEGCLDLKEDPRPPQGNKP